MPAANWPRCGSGHGHGPYSIECEYDDVPAMLAEAGKGAALVGHSFGAICALGAALRHPVPRLVVYEPPLPAGGPVGGQHLAPYARAVEAGDVDAALEIGFTHFPRLSPEAIATLRASKAWPRLRTLAPSWIREMAAMDALGPDLSRYRALDVPVLRLKGEVSPEHPMQDAARALAQVLPRVRVATLAGQGHDAMRVAPGPVARLIQEFLAE